MDYEFMEYIRKSIEVNERVAKEIAMKKRQEKAMELLEKSGLGKRFAKRNFENFEKNGLTPKLLHAYNKSLEFANSFPEVGKGLLFTGPVGTGKTHLAAAIANKLMENLYSVIFGNVTDIITLIKTTYRKDSEMTEAEMIKLFTDDTDVFIFDDLGKENATENTSTLIYQIVNRLYENEKPVVVTTNFTSAALRKKLGEKGDAIMSRLAEMCEIIKVEGPDWRLKAVQGE